MLTLLRARTPRPSGTLGVRLVLGIFLLLASGSMALSTPAPVAAHQPVVVDSETTEVSDPEISKAYYATLAGEPQRYQIDSPVAFDLYVGILVPDDGSPVKDVVAEIFQGDELLVRLGGVEAEWVTFYERFGGNTYWDGGEHRLRAAPGVYTVVVSSVDNTSSYSLAIGEIEFFGWGDRVNALAILPGIQQEFFGLSAFSLLGTPYGLINLVVIYGAALVAALLYRGLLRHLFVRLIGGTPRGIRRGVRAAVGAALFVVAITTTWSPLLLFLSGLLLVEALLARRGAARVVRGKGTPSR
jgi:hypothetical protein